MSEPRGPRSDGTSRRHRQVEATRAAIVTAFLDLAHAENSATVSMPAVAEAAGISVRTVYRYFPTKDALQEAAAMRFADQAQRATIGTAPVDGSNFRPYLLELWTNFADEIPAVLAEHCTPVGRELRAARLPGSRETVRASGVLTNGAIDDETVDLVVALTSSSMFIELVVRMGHSPERAVAMVTRMVERLVNAPTPASASAAAAASENELNQEGSR